MSNGLDMMTLERIKKVADELQREAEYTESAQKNLKGFWDLEGPATIKKYKSFFKEPKIKEIPSELSFNSKIKKCKAVIITANSVEGAIVTKRLMQSSNKRVLELYVKGGNRFQFGEINGIKVVHVWPLNTSSFTQFGSFQAVDMSLEKCAPRYVFSVGVAFGTDPDHQQLGNVLISKELVFYDNFNKVTDGTIKLSEKETYHIDKDMEARLPYFNLPHDAETEWHYGSLLTGGTVLSDANERNKLVAAAAKCNLSVIGGEMEASGIYYACQKVKNRNIPFLVIKGICDWGAVKNGWAEITKSTAYKDKNDLIKDCVQAYACDNAFDKMCTIMEHLPF